MQLRGWLPWITVASPEALRQMKAQLWTRGRSVESVSVRRWGLILSLVSRRYFDRIGRSLRMNLMNFWPVWIFQSQKCLIRSAAMSVLNLMNS